MRYINLHLHYILHLMLGLFLPARRNA